MALLSPLVHCDKVIGPLLLTIQRDDFARDRVSCSNDSCGVVVWFLPSQRRQSSTNILFRSPKAKENEVSRHNPKSSKPNKKDEKLFHLKFNGKDTNKKG